MPKGADVASTRRSLAARKPAGTDRSRDGVARRQPVDDYPSSIIDLALRSHLHESSIVTGFRNDSKRLRPPQRVKNAAIRSIGGS
jgi:hypothetical protein